MKEQGICWFLSVRHVVDSSLGKTFRPQEGLLQLEKRYKTSMQDEKHSRINRGGAMHM